MVREAQQGLCTWPPGALSAGHYSVPFMGGLVASSPTTPGPRDRWLMGRDPMALPLTAVLWAEPHSHPAVITFA